MERDGKKKREPRKTTYFMWKETGRNREKLLILCSKFLIFFSF